MTPTESLWRPLPEHVTLRTQIRPGDIGAIIRWHGELYSREFGFDATFEAYVAVALGQFVLSQQHRDRLWIAERDRDLVGSAAIVGADSDQAQFRWFLVDPSLRGQGLGQRLMQEALAFAVQCGYRSVFLWTVSALEKAARLYLAAGFQKTQEKPGRWGVEVIEEKYELALSG
jgi:GNAT superfamily N-acetyltransferase